jgi:hypothetical protein
MACLMSWRAANAIQVEIYPWHGRLPWIMFPTTCGVLSFKSCFATQGLSSRHPTLPLCFPLRLSHQASWGARPDVWVQLLRRLLCDENGSFLHTALQQPSTGPGADLQAVAVQRMLRFAATLTDLPECVRSQLKHLAASLPV